MHRAIPYLLAPACLLLVAALPAGATSVSWTATGTVTDATATNGSLPTGVGNGDAVAVTWSYESSAGSSPLGGGRRYASGLSLAATILIEGHEWTGSGNAIDIFNDNPFDAWTMRLQESEGATFSSFPNPGAGAHDLIVFQLADNTNPFQLLSSLDLPDEDMDLTLAALVNDITVTFGNIRGENALGEGYQLTFSIDPTSVSTVPEPSIAWLAGAGLLALASRRRRA